MSLSRRLLRVLPASTFHSFIHKGGSTRPWVVLLDENGNDVPYVVKLFSERDLQFGHSILKEVLGCALAKQFDLKTPEFALAEFSDDFIQHSLGNEQRNILSRKAGGLKFASRLLSSPVIYTPIIARDYMKSYDYANLYAFDSLIHNMDRGRRSDKPNLLLNDDDFILIDHELSFASIDNLPAQHNAILQAVDDGEFPYLYQQHLAYPFLKGVRKSEKASLFDEFESNLSTLNIQAIRLVVSELLRLDISCGYYDRIFEYLHKLKENSRKFSGILLRSIL